jgi:hypothetical protein
MGIGASPHPIDESDRPRAGVVVRRASDWSPDRIASERTGDLGDTRAGALRAQRQREQAALQVLAMRVSAMRARREARVRG